MKFLDKLEESLITLLIGMATLITFFAVVHRYMSGFAIPGLQDTLLSINMRPSLVLLMAFAPAFTSGSMYSSIA